MNKVFNLTSAQHLKAYSHPIRQKMLLLLHEKEMTNAELADEMEIPRGQLHFHTKQLLTAGLIKIVGTRMKGPITEKLYRASAKRYVIETLPIGVEPSLETSYEIGLDLYRRRNYGVVGNPTLASCLMIPMSKEKAEQFHKRLNELHDDLLLQSENLDENDDELYAFTMVMHRLTT